MNQESGVVTFCGRVFTAQEVELMGEVAGDYAALGVTEIARTICELLAWKRPSGGLKNHECRQLLEPLRDHPHVGDVRGRGLLLGIELVADKESRRPFPRSERKAESVFSHAFEAGLGSGLVVAERRSCVRSFSIRV
jgi:acetylornithine/succinyldiaminopimelate/putrescine aminotransferase